jgi:hypothetical protein
MIQLTHHPIAAISQQARGIISCKITATKIGETV